MTTKLKDKYDTGRKVNDEPVVVVFEDFLDDLEVEHLINAAQSSLQQALVSDANSGAQSPGRTGRNCWIPHAYDPVIQRLSLRVADLVGMPLENAESLQVVHYAQTQEYAPHFDAWDASTERGKRCMARGGQRLITCLLYLNTVEAGGGTSFPRLNMEVRARQRRMVLFHNCQGDSNVRHPDSLHGGLPVSEGEKWACNFWFREKSYQIPAPAPTRTSEPKPAPTAKRII